MLTLIFAMSFLCLAEQRAFSGEDVEIFVQGEKYNSIREYKSNRLKLQLKRALDLSENYREVDVVYEELVSQYSEKTLRKLNVTDLVYLINELQASKHAAQSSQYQDGSIDQMEGLLEDYLVKHKKSKSLKLNPEKMKTVVITPSDD